MKKRTITGILTYSSQANRDAALVRINSAIATYNLVNFTSAVGTGVTTSGTTQIIVSLEEGTPDIAFDVGKAIYDAAVSTNRHTSGYLSVNTL